jgi:hypothetical protein
MNWQHDSAMTTSTGESKEKLDHAAGEAARLYRPLPRHALIGTESTGSCQWLVEIATAQGYNPRIGGVAKIHASNAKKIGVSRTVSADSVPH